MPGNEKSDDCPRREERKSDADPSLDRGGQWLRKRSREGDDDHQEYDTNAG